MKEKPNILENYQELMIQFGFIVLFSTVFPPAALFSVISNVVQIDAQLSNMQYTRRFKAEVSDGIGTWMYCISTLCQMSIIMNCATIYFTSAVLERLFVKEKHDAHHKELADWSTKDFLLFVVLVEHVMILLKMALEQAIDDVPPTVVAGER